MPSQETLQLLSEAQDEPAMRQALLAVRRASMNCYTFEVSAVGQPCHAGTTHIHMYAAIA